MKTKIIICKKCNSKRIKTVKKYNKNVYICLECNGHSYDTTKKKRYLRNDDYTIYDENISIKDRLKLYNFLFKNIKTKNKFLNTKNIDSSLKRWLDINYIIINGLNITLENVFNYSKNIQEEDMICKNPNCNNKTEFFAIHNRYPNGRKFFCSQKCDYEYKSFRQLGEKNICHKINDKTKRIMSINQSKLMKEKIKNGEFTPNITNSWSNSMTKIKINNKIKNYRSTWEAFFNLVNSDFLYEKIRIEYLYNNKKHIYIVDFVDEKNKELYEIKPTSERYKLKNKLKTKYAIEWCIKNGYNYNIVDNKWFENNYNNNKYLIYGQLDEKKLLKNLKQFDNENKKYK